MIRLLLYSSDPDLPVLLGPTLGGEFSILLEPWNSSLGNSIRFAIWASPWSS
jgi:hypothetical protein